MDHKHKLMQLDMQLENNLKKIEHAWNICIVLTKSYVTFAYNV